MEAKGWGIGVLLFAVAYTQGIAKDKASVKADWKFDQPPNCAVFTTKDIVKGRKDITYVFHDAEDEGWQFLDSGETREDRASVVALSTIVALDSTVKQVAEMQPGFHAFRKSKSEKWEIRKTE